MEPGIERREERTGEGGRDEGATEQRREQGRSE